MTAIPSLWPEIKVDIITPYAILQTQASRLSEVTKGLLRAEVVSTEDNGSEKGYDFDLIAPVLNNYRHTLLFVEQLSDFDYPVRVEGVADTNDGTKVWRQDARPLAQIATSINKYIQATAKEDTTIIFTDTAFIQRVGQILQSPQAQAIIYSLIARSNEQRKPTDMSYAELLHDEPDNELDKG